MPNPNVGAHIHPSKERLLEIANHNIADEYEGKHVQECAQCLRFINEVLKQKTLDRKKPK
jgi:hypothetical protein